MYRAVSDPDLLMTILFVKDVQDTWQFLEDDVRQRLRNYVSSLPVADFVEIDFLLEFPPLHAQARHRVQIATKKELSSQLYFGMPKEVADKYIAFYLESKSFDDANEWAKQMLIYTDDFKADHIRKLLVGAGKNSQVSGSFQIGPLINKLRLWKTLPEDEFEQLLSSNKLEEHTLAARGNA